MITGEEAKQGETDMLDDRIVVDNVRCYWNFKEVRDVDASEWNTLDVIHFPNIMNGVQPIPNISPHS